MFKINHLLTGEELIQTGGQGLKSVLELAESLKEDRKWGRLHADLKGKGLAILLEKPSFRTHFSFSLAMQELGGMVVESPSGGRKKEDPEDVARVLNGYCHGVVLRTFSQSILEKMAAYSKIPIINGLSDTHHPCQILADLLTLKQSFGELKGLSLTYIGDGNNILNSLLLLAPALGVEVRYACPQGYQPDPEILQRAVSRSKELPGSIQSFEDPSEAVRKTNAIYTDVWTSMGFEAEGADREKAFQGYQLNSALYKLATPGAAIMHCLPMEKGKEITQEMVDHPSSVIFRQSENRLHAQKAVLLGLLSGSFG